MGGFAAVEGPYGLLGLGPYGLLDLGPYGLLGLNL